MKRRGEGRSPLDALCHPQNADLSVNLKEFFAKNAGIDSQSPRSARFNKNKKTKGMNKIVRSKMFIV
jgi:hypothetical protein